MRKELQMSQAILALAAKNINISKEAITEKKIGAWPMHSEGIQEAVKKGYIRIIENGQEPPKYYLSDYGKEFVIQVLRLLED